MRIVSVPEWDGSLLSMNEASAPVPPLPPIDTAADAALPFLGTWSLVGTEQYVCAAETSEIIPESATMTFRPGPGATDAGQVDLLFDGGLGCSIAMSVTNGAAALTSAPRPAGFKASRSIGRFSRSRRLRRCSSPDGCDWRRRTPINPDAPFSSKATSFRRAPIGWPRNSRAPPSHHLGGRCLFANFCSPVAAT